MNINNINLVYLLGEIKRGLNEQFYIPNLNTSVENSHNYSTSLLHTNFSYIANTNSIPAKQLGHTWSDNLPTQVYKMYGESIIEYFRPISHKTYELKDHLGNVRAVITDEKLLEDSEAFGVAGHNEISAGDYFSPNIVTFSDFYPFGMLARQGKNPEADNYRYAYQGSEVDNEVKGDGNSYTTSFRQLDPKLGRWLSIDPKATAWESPYVSMANNPIWYNAPLGDTIKFLKSSSPNFIKQVTTYLKQISSTELGKVVVKRLNSYNGVFVISELDENITKSNFKFGKHVPQGVDAVGFLSLGSGRANIDGVVTDQFTGFSHELFHAFQFTMGEDVFKALNSQKGDGGILPFSEIQAVGFENYIRASFDKDGPRLRYTTNIGKTIISVPIIEYTKNRWNLGANGWILSGGDAWDYNDFTNYKFGIWATFHLEAVSKELDKEYDGNCEPSYEE